MLKLSNAPASVQGAAAEVHGAPPWRRSMTSLGSGSQCRNAGRNSLETGRQAVARVGQANGARSQRLKPWSKSALLTLFFCKTTGQKHTSAALSPLWLKNTRARHLFSSGISFTAGGCFTDCKNA